jgi:hypothetical protein
MFVLGGSMPRPPHLASFDSIFPLQFHLPALLLLDVEGRESAAVILFEKRWSLLFSLLSPSPF